MKRTVQDDDFARKRKIRQKKIRRRRIKAVLCILLVLALITGVTLSLTVLFPIKQINAKGSNRYSAEQIISALGIKPGDNLFTAGVSVSDVRKKLPYAEDIKIERKLPDNIVIVFKDATEYACYSTLGKYYSVSKSGYILNLYSELPQGLFEIRVDNFSGSLGEKLKFTDDKTENLINGILGFAEENSVKMNYLDLKDKLSITAKVEGRFIVDFGTSNNLQNKFAHLASMIKNIETGKTGKINLSMWTAANTEGTFVAGSVE